MRARVRYHDLAELELRETSKYYESEVRGLGGALLSEVEHSIDQIRSYPQAAPIVLGVVRQRVL